jgi:nitrite reductase (cytochrome c-552)
VRSPLLNVNRACQTCHRASENELLARVDVIQERNYALMQRGGAAIVALIDTIVAAKAAGRDPEAAGARPRLQRKAQWRLDFIAAENSMGFHAPQEAARILGEALDDARRGQLAARALLPAGAVVPTPAAPATPAPATPAPAPATPATPAAPAAPAPAK